MSQELVPIKVKIGLRNNGHADHPDWTKMSMITFDQDVRQYAPSGWIYDKSSGHKDDTLDSPYGQQWGCLLCTRAFADEAKLVFPTIITELTEAEFEDFYNNKSRVHMQENKYDNKALEGLERELNLKEKLGQDTVSLQTKIVEALDPNDSEPGIAKNEDRYWADYKVKKGFTIK